MVKVASIKNIIKDLTPSSNEDYREMSGFTTSATLAEMIKRPMRKRRRSGKKKKKKKSTKR